MNYGSVLQAYALQNYINSKGIRCDIINYLMPYDYEKYKLFRVGYYKSRPQTFVSDIIFLGKNIKRKNKFNEFRNKYLSITSKVYRNWNEMIPLNQSYDGFICGSDQIWNFDCTNGVDPAYFLKFADRNKVIAAYAPSMAQVEFNCTFENEISSLINRFDYISVREKSSKNFIEKLTNKPVQIVCDPTMLLPVSRYRSIEILPHEKKGYVFVYLLEYNAQLIRYANQISKEKNIPLIYISNISIKAGKQFSNGKGMYGIGPEEFLGYIDACEYLITNSFHATVFGILMHKRFITFKTTKSYPRLVDLLARLKLEKRIYSEKNAIDDTIDYNFVDKMLDEYIISSKGYLNKIVASILDQ